MGEYGYYRVLKLRGLAGAVRCFRELVREHGGRDVPFRGERCSLAVRDCTPELLHSLREAARGALDEAEILLIGQKRLGATVASAHFARTRRLLEKPGRASLTLQYCADHPMPGLDAKAERRIAISSDGTLEIGQCMDVSFDAKPELDRTSIRTSAEEYLRRSAALLGAELDVEVELAAPGTWPVESSVRVSSRTAHAEVAPAVQGAEIELKLRDGHALDHFADLLTRIDERPTRVSLISRGTLVDAIVPFEKTKMPLKTTMFGAEVEVDDAFLARLSKNACADGAFAIESAITLGTKKNPLELGVALEVERGKARVELTKKWGLTPAEHKRLETKLGLELDDDDIFD